MAFLFNVITVGKLRAKNSEDFNGYIKMYHLNLSGVAKLAKVSQNLIISNVFYMNSE